MAGIDIVVVLCAIFICGFPGLTNYILTYSEADIPRDDPERSVLLVPISQNFIRFWDIHFREMS
jgi:hypothetical protein